jgi:putative membrane protein
VIISWLVAAVHLLALGVGLGAVWARGRALLGVLDATGLRRVFAADTWWGIAAGLWIATGLARAFAGLEKGTEYYLHSHAFWIKMILLGLVLALEVSPMLALIRWRIQFQRGEQPDTARSRRLAQISFVQAGLIVFMVFAATALARGYGGRIG